MSGIVGIERALQVLEGLVVPSAAEGNHGASQLDVSEHSPGPYRQGDGFGLTEKHLRGCPVPTDGRNQ